MDCESKFNPLPLSLPLFVLVIIVVVFVIVIGSMVVLSVLSVNNEHRNSKENTVHINILLLNILKRR